MAGANAARAKKRQVSETKGVGSAGEREDRQRNNLGDKQRRADLAPAPPRRSKSAEGSPSRPPLPDLLRRLVRQEREDTLAVKLLPRVVFTLAAGYTLFYVGSSSASAFIGVCLVLVLALAGWFLRHRGQLVLALISTPVTLALTGYMATVAEVARGGPGGAITGQAVFGYWALTGMALLGAWMLKDHPGRRGITVVIADVVLIFAAFVGTLFPVVAVPIGFLGIVAVLMIRGRGFTAMHQRTKTVLALPARIRARMGKGS
ncbi:hypothetical protein [Streptomyces sp. H27-C3]|uniref:hypothetical protein n=1 Tax=Streptomyces sp. H27-C3 TaxID=3046305 RepID=UPI0024BACA99|nr:hypothetical protein [Streptomyces sp. H27-C3]MDJ0464310.1 hypothetical protein [Streptomyces sp. H27-C3]